MKNVYRFIITTLLAGALFAAHAGSLKEAYPAYADLHVTQIEAWSTMGATLLVHAD